MQHLGDITQLSGSKIEPVSVITFGSPCQDLSVAGMAKAQRCGQVRSSHFQLRLQRIGFKGIKI